MNTKTIQQILDEQRQTAEIYKKTSKQINSTIVASLKRDNPVFSARMSETAHERNQRPDYQAAYQAGIAGRDNTYQARDNARPEKRAQISATMKGRKKSQEHQDKIAIRNQERSKRIATPDGEFPSRRAAVEHMTLQGTGNAGGKIDKWLRTRPTEYYYLDK
jgi:hypothetical protein